MKVALVCPRYPPSIGGIETHVAALAVRIAALGHEVEVLTQERRSLSLPRIEHSDGIVVRRFAIIGRGLRYPQAPRLWRYLAAHAGDYDLVHAHSYHATPALAAAFAPCHELVFTPHYLGGGQTLLARLAHVPYRPLGSLIFRRANLVICMSAVEADLVRLHFPKIGGRIAVIPNGVDLRELEAARPFPDTSATVLCAGRLEPYKNVQAVVLALHHLPREFHLVIAGEGPARRQLAELAERTGVGDRVRLLGPVPHEDMYRWFRTASVFVTMSARENFGITLVEALGAGAAVVASDIPTHREICTLAAPGAVSLVSGLAGPIALADAIQAAAAAPIHGGGSLPTWDSIAKSTLDLYTSVASATNHAP